VTVIETTRLVLRELTADDAAFMVELLNDASFLRYIGDRGVRTLDDARRYIETGPRASYAQHGFGLYLVEPKAGGEAMGICGLLKRDALPDADVGFAFLPRFWGRGYAFESASAVLVRGREVHGLRRVLAITSPDNAASIGLLGKLGFVFERMTRLSEGAHEVRVFAREL
jgi:ribosomal-protein-alanine N-acetyltransferase